MEAVLSGAGRRRNKGEGNCADCGVRKSLGKRSRNFNEGWNKS